MNRHKHTPGKMAQAVLVATTLMSSTVMSADEAVTHTAAQSDHPQPVSDRTVGRSSWGADDEICRLNLMTPASQLAILARIAGGTSYDLSVRNARENEGGES
jgi:hypothetical protein